MDTEVLTQEDLEARLRVACATSPRLRDRVQRSLYAQYIVDDTASEFVVLWSLDAARRIQTKAVLTTVRTDGQFVKHVVVGRSHAAIHEYVSWNGLCTPMHDVDLDALGTEEWLWRAIGHECGETVEIECATCSDVGVTVTGLDHDFDFTFTCNRVGCSSCFWRHPGDVAAELGEPRPSVTENCRSCGVDTKHEYTLTICQVHQDRAFYRCIECKTVTEVTY